MAYDPHNLVDDGWMQFRLTYTGPLYAVQDNDAKSRHKQEIRKVFHQQLKRLWEINPILQAHDKADFIKMHKTMQEHLAEEYSYNGYNFIPLVVPELFLLCDIKVLFLRPEEPGSLIESGDIDNRLKTIFDALRIPKTKGQLGGYDSPEADEKPFYCLLPEDRLISGVSVETDILLEANASPTIHDSKLVITVNIKPYKATWGNMGFATG